MMNSLLSMSKTIFWVPLSEGLPLEDGEYLVAHYLPNGEKPVSFVHYDVKHDYWFCSQTPMYWSDKPEAPGAGDK